MSLIDFDSIPEPLVDLMYSALDHGIGSVILGNGPLIPFLLVQNGSDIRIHRFAAEELAEGIIEAEQFVRDLKPAPEYFAIAFDGYLTLHGKKHDAIYVKGFCDGDEMVRGRLVGEARLLSYKMVGVLWRNREKREYGDDKARTEAALRSAFG